MKIEKKTEFVCDINVKSLCSSSIYGALIHYISYNLIFHEEIQHIGMESFEILTGYDSFTIKQCFKTYENWENKI